jgi:hypothetical protein
VEEGGAMDGFVRIALLIAKAGSGRRKLSSMERVRELIAPAHLLDGVSEDEFRRLMHEETIIVEYEPDRARRALPRLLKGAADRRHAHDLLQAIETHSTLEPRQLALAGELRALLPVASRSHGAPALPSSGAKRSAKRPAGRGTRATARRASA